MSLQPRSSGRRIQVLLWAVKQSMEFLGKSSCFGFASLPVLICLSLIVSPSVAQTEEPIASGLVVELRGKGTELSDFRRDRRAALSVEAGGAVSPFVVPGPFEAIWRGALRLEKRERLYFSFEGFGKASLLIDGEVILEANGENLSTVETERLRLNGGDHPLEVRYASAESGAGRFRLLWKGRDFARETISPKAYGYVATSADIKFVNQADTLRKGRFLTATHGCTRCHRPDEPFDSITAMPEVSANAPSLLGVGSRLREKWMAKWILNPKQNRPSARMPLMVDSAEEARHLARFLAGLNEDSEKNPLSGDLRKGGALFAKLGCISCHRIAKGDPKDASERIPLLEVEAKFLPGALAEFLRAPGKHYPWTRMPDFKLSPAEAADIATFLRSLNISAIEPEPISGNAAKGEALFAVRGCAACHESPVKNTLDAPGFAALREKSARGCLVDAPNGPRFGFSLEERTALMKFLGEGEESLHRNVPQEFAERQFTELRCAACHARDDEDSLWDVFSEEVSAWNPKEPEAIAEEENPEQAHPANRVPPALTFAGEKLRPEWTASFLAGEIKGKPRTWMHARMPAFPARAKLLAEGLACGCGISQKDSREKASDDLAGAIKAGAQITNLLCVTCHGIGDRGPTAVFEGQGINLLVSRQRLRKEHYLRWMLNPYRINASTIMPKFADEEGRTGLIDLLEGDAHRQFDAVWRYLKDFR